MLLPGDLLRVGLPPDLQDHDVPAESGELAVLQKHCLLGHLVSRPCVCACGDFGRGYFLCQFAFLCLVVWVATDSNSKI